MYVCVLARLLTNLLFHAKMAKKKALVSLKTEVSIMVECQIGILQEKNLMAESSLVLYHIQPFNDGLNDYIVCLKYSLTLSSLMLGEICTLWLPRWLSGKESVFTSSIPGSGRSSGEENCNSIQYSCLVKSIGRGAS